MVQHEIEIRTFDYQARAFFIVLLQEMIVMKTISQNILYKVHKQSEAGTDITQSQLWRSKINNSRGHFCWTAHPLKDL